MTKEEMIKIMSMLSAFYGEGKSNVEFMAPGWYELVGHFEYEAVKQAVLNYAKNDTREYASFPAPGHIIKLAKEEMQIYENVYNSIASGSYYELIDPRGQKLISKEEYDKLKMLPKDELALKKDRIIESLKPAENQKLIGGC